MVRLPVPPPEKGFGGRQWEWVMKWIITNMTAMWNTQLIIDAIMIAAIVVLFILFGRS